MKQTISNLESIIEDYDNEIKELNRYIEYLIKQRNTILFPECDNRIVFLDDYNLDKELI